MKISNYLRHKNLGKPVALPKMKNNLSGIIRLKI